jgi:uncharacterized protein YutE (UPF0331/DUF86 family)
LKREVKVRLIRHITFLENELEDFETFKSLSWEVYQRERSKRRDVERWVENIVNSSIDISKILLISESISIPETYKELVTSVSLIHGFNKENVQTVSEWIRFRNVIAHEYLDIRWSSIQKFIQEAEPLFRDFVKEVKGYLERKG